MKGGAPHTLRIFNNVCQHIATKISHLKCFKCFTRSFQGCTPSYHSKLQLKCQVEVQQFVGIVSCTRPVHVHQISFIVGPMSSCNACHASSYLVATWWPCRVQRLEKCLGCLLVIHHHDAIWSHVPSMYNPTIFDQSFVPK